MTLASTNLVPELQYWVNSFILGSSVNKNKFLSPAEIGSVYMPQKSFIELLFNSSYATDTGSPSIINTSYRYMYTENTDRYSWPGIVKNRMLIYPASAKYYNISDSTGLNLFLLESEDLTLLDALLQYRIDSTSVTIIDSTSVTFINNILHATYSNLTKPLAKLIFLYLDLKIYSHISNYNTTTLIAPISSALLNSYEAYVLDEMFKLVSERGI